MTNKLQLDRLLASVEEWNEWRHKNAITLELERANLFGANLIGANLKEGDLTGANLEQANLRGANLNRASLADVNFHKANLSNSTLDDAFLSGSVFRNTILTGAHLHRASFRSTVFIGLNLSEVVGLETCIHFGPSSIDNQTLAISKNLPEKFLLGCGLTRWEVLSARLLDTTLSPDNVADITSEIFQLRSEGPLGGIFISYAHSDGSEIAQRLYKTIKQRGTSVWMDSHELLAGPTAQQVERGIRLNDVVILVLSEAALQSDWVNYEINQAREKEKSEGRNVLCPIAIDSAWKDEKKRTVIDPVLWNYLVNKYNILNFSGGESSFDSSFKKLWKGITLEKCEHKHRNMI